MTTPTDPMQGNEKDESLEKLIKRAYLKKSTQHFVCGKCDKGIIDYIVGENGEQVTVEIKKCTVCKHQYGIKEICNANLKPLFK